MSSILGYHPIALAGAIIMMVCLIGTIVFFILRGRKISNARETRGALSGAERKLEQAVRDFQQLLMCRWADECRVRIMVCITERRLFSRAHLRSAETYLAQTNVQDACNKNEAARTELAYCHALMAQNEGTLQYLLAEGVDLIRNTFEALHRRTNDLLSHIEHSCISGNHLQDRIWELKLIVIAMHNGVSEEQIEERPLVVLRALLQHAYALSGATYELGEAHKWHNGLRHKAVLAAIDQAKYTTLLKGYVDKVLAFREEQHCLPTFSEEWRVSVAAYESLREVCLATELHRIEKANKHYLDGGPQESVIEGLDRFRENTALFEPLIARVLDPEDSFNAEEEDRLTRDEHGIDGDLTGIV